MLDVLVAGGSRLLESDRARRLSYELRNRRTFVDLYQHDRMLADRVRVDAYQAALTKHLTPHDVVVDLGSGTGVLSFLAAPYAAEVHGVEHGPLVAAAAAVAEENGIDNVRFHHLHSRSFTLPEKADVLVHEQLGDALLDERVVENVIDLRERVLKPGGRILPNRLELFIEPVQLAEGMRAPHAWNQAVHGITFRSLRSLADQQGRSYWYQLFRPFPFGHFLAAPRPVLSVDLETIRPEDVPHSLTVEREVVREGHLDGFVVYFAAHFDDELSFGTCPAAPPTSWGTPLLRADARLLAPGATARLELTATDLASPGTWRWAVP